MKTFIQILSLLILKISRRAAALMDEPHLHVIDGIKEMSLPKQVSLS
jgi:hypothetical protein